MREGRKRRSETGERTKWYDFLDIPVFGEDFGVVAIVLAVALVLVLLWFVAMPLLAPLIGLLGQLAWLLLLIPLVFTWNVIGRRPWIVDAVSVDGTRLASWKVSGWLASGRLEREVVASGVAGISIDTVRTDLQIGNPPD
jgi:hypothetical protein